MFSQDCPAGSSPAVVPAAPDPAQVAGAVDRYLALREFRARLYRCLAARADALFELCDAILCADHAVTSLARVASCDCGEETSCYGCLRGYRNQPFHEELQRGAALGFLLPLVSAGHARQ